MLFSYYHYYCGQRPCIHNIVNYYCCCFFVENLFIPQLQRLFCHIVFFVFTILSGVRVYVFIGTHQTPNIYILCPYVGTHQSIILVNLRSVQTDCLVIVINPTIIVTAVLRATLLEAVTAFYYCSNKRPPIIINHNVSYSL